MTFGSGQMCLRPLMSATALATCAEGSVIYLHDTHIMLQCHLLPGTRTFPKPLWLERKQPVVPTLACMMCQYITQELSP